MKHKIVANIFKSLLSRISVFFLVQFSYSDIENLTRNGEKCVLKNVLSYETYLAP